MVYLSATVTNPGSNRARCRATSYLVLVFSDPGDTCGDAAAVEANKYGECDDEHLVAEQSPARVGQEMKQEKAGNTGSQVDHTDCHQ